MPIVRIDLREGAVEGFGKRVGDVVHRTKVDPSKVPAGDNFQIITEPDPEGLVYDANSLGISRTDGLVIIQIALDDGRPVGVKRAFYEHSAGGLHREPGVRREDVFMELIEARKGNRSFGDGVAQYAT